MLGPNKNARLLSDLLKKVDEKKPEKETLAQVNSSFCLNKNKNKIAEFTQSLDAMRTKLSGLAKRSFADVLRSNGYARLTSSARAAQDDRLCEVAHTAQPKSVEKAVFAKPKKVAAFTLAEVLVTLGIIGIVAAMTMPTLMEHHKKQVTVTSLQKMYSTLMNAAMMYQAENELTFDEFDTSMDSKTFMQIYMLPYLDTIQECSSFNFCYGDKVPLAIDRKTKITTEGLWVLKNGSFLGASKHAGGMLFYFDINGAKGPNWSGRDIFYYFLINKSKISNFPGCSSTMRTLQSGLYPGAYADCFKPYSKYDRDILLGTSLDRACNHNAPHVTDNAGDACATLIMQDGWKISDDYPW